MEEDCFERQREWKKGIFDHHITRKCQTNSLNKLTSKELYLILVDANAVTPAVPGISRILMKYCSLTGKTFVICNTILDANACMFQYKVLHDGDNILFAKKYFLKMKK